MNPSALFVLAGLALTGTVACEAAPADPSSTGVTAQASRPKAIDPSRLPYYGDATFTPLWAQGEQTLPEQFHRLPDFSLTNQHGDRVTAGTFAGKVFVANFFFTACPGICRQMNTNMARVQEALADDDGVMLLSHSVTPDVDTPQVLHGYAERFGAIAGKWHMVTGDRDDIYALGRQGYFVEEDQGQPRSKEAFLHSENLIVVDAERRLRGIYDGLNKTDVDRLIRDLKTLRANQDAPPQSVPSTADTHAKI